MSKRNKFRKLINDIHLWLGLGGGIILFIICLTGTLYVFKSDIEYCINPDKYNVSSDSSNKNLLKIEELISMLEKEQEGKVTSVLIPENKSKNYQFELIKIKKAGKETASQLSVEKRGKERPTTYYIDPYSGEIRGKDGDKISHFFTSIMKLHRWLLLKNTIGRPIVGISTLIFVIISLSGLILWLPKKLKYWKRWSHWKPGFKIKFTARWKRINHDLHNTLGFYSLIFLLIMATTGLCWSFGWYKDGISYILGSEVFAGRKEKSMPVKNLTSARISFLSIITISTKELPYKGDIKIKLPKDSASAITIYKNKTGFFALSASDKLFLDPYTSQVLFIDKFEDKPLNVQIVSLIKPLHLGNIYGTFSKIIYFITCLIGTSLPITGTFIWINKKKKKGFFNKRTP